MPARRTTPGGYGQARRQRKHATPAEERLWAFLRRAQLCGVSFRRQHAIGPYVVDFCSPATRLIIEVDGSGHMARQEQDRQRMMFLASRGYHVLRFWNDQVMNDTEGVVSAIQKVLPSVS